MEPLDVFPQCRVDPPHERDALLERRAYRALENDPYFRGRTHQLELNVCHGRMTIRGRVPSFFLKQILQTVLCKVEGVEQVDNCVDVTSPCGMTH
jgi:hypothetical protein